MKEIVAVDRNWGIGYEGKLLKRIPEDMARFRQMTLNSVVVMGRETFESLPKQEPLKDRVNIVLSKRYENEKVTICRSLAELFTELNKYNTDDVYVIGGGSVYAQLLPYCDEAYVTKIDSAYPADTYFVNLDEEQGWVLASESETMEYQEIGFRYAVYENQALRIYAGQGE